MTEANAANVPKVPLWYFVAPCGTRISLAGYRKAQEAVEAAKAAYPDSQQTVWPLFRLAPVIAAEVTRDIANHAELLQRLRDRPRTHAWFTLQEEWPAVSRDDMTELQRRLDACAAQWLVEVGVPLPLCVIERATLPVQPVQPLEAAGAAVAAAFGVLASAFEETT